MNQRERIEQLKAEAMRLSGGKMQSFGLDALPPLIAEQFLKRVIAFETAPTTTNYDQLIADGVPVPTPAAVSDGDIGAVLWRVITALATHRTFLERTDHLSDRALYAVLWHHVLHEEIAVIPDEVEGEYHVDIPCNEGDPTNYLTYYASNEERAEWRRDFPDAAVPPRQLPAFDRDRHLPQPHREDRSE